MASKMAPRPISIVAVVPALPVRTLEFAVALLTVQVKCVAVVTLVQVRDCYQWNVQYQLCFII